MPSRIKLIIVDFYGVMTAGSYVDTCWWLSRKYHLPYKYLYDLIYHKYFSRAAVGKYSERESFEIPAKLLGFEENWKVLRAKHLSFQKLRKPVFRLCLDLQKQGYKVLLLSKNTVGQFNYAMRKMSIRKYFKNIINTYYLGLPKGSRKTIKYILKKFKTKPHEVVMIDDQEFNLVVAKAIGVKTILYKNFKQFRKELHRILQK